jgi:hypothetical protein
MEARTTVPQPVECQIRSPARFSEGILPLLDHRLRMRARLALKRRLSPEVREALRRRRMRYLHWRAGSSPVPAAALPPDPAFEAGELVRVRGREEIMATLDPGQKLRGCGFLEEMAPYCGTTQRVLKPVRQFVDERDLRMKKARGIYLLEGAMCHGAAPFGECDRGCLYFWRGEWLERLPGAGGPPE